MLANRGKKWSNDDVIKLINLYNENKDTKEISNNLQRTEYAITKKITDIIIEFNKNFDKEYKLFLNNQIKTNYTNIIKKYSNEDNKIYNEVSIIINDLVDNIVNNELINDYTKDLNELQLKAFTDVMDKKNVLISGEAGCHAYGTKILMYNNYFKEIQNININDIVMGDNSQPRYVKKLIRGKSKMYRVHHYDTNDYYDVNEDHILTLYYKKSKNIIDDKNNSCYIVNWFSGIGTGINTIKFIYTEDNKHIIYKNSNEYMCKIKENKTIDIKLSDYLKLDKDMKNNLYGIKRKIEFKYKNYTLCPYIAGGMYGINTISNYYININVYKYNIIKVRKLFIAGIVDNYAEIYNNKYYINFYEFTSKIENITFILSSIGIKYKIKNKTIIFSAILPVKYKVLSNFYDIDNFYNIILYKINIEYLKEDNYYGITVSSNNRYIMYNGIVTHNCGKSFLLKNIIRYLKYKKVNFGVTASTGMAANLIGGTTIHSFLKIGIANKSAADLYSILLNKNKTTFNKIKKLKVLIIDEISMIDNILFSKIAKLISLIKDINKPFGDLQLILSGDFCQLKPVNNTYCFLSKIWIKLNLNTTILKEQIRQSDDVKFQQILSKLRFGEVSKEIYDKLKPLVNKKFNNNDIKPTILYSTNKNVDYINEAEYKKQLAKNDILKEYTFSIIYDKDNRKISSYIKSLPTTNLKLCINLQVIITYNIDIENGVVNGSRGVIVDIFNNNIYVKLLNEKVISITYVTYSNDVDKDITYKYIPLKLAYALTIHKSIGCTIDMVEMDLGNNVFEYGQGYTALSRARTMDSIKLLDLNMNSFKAHPEVIKFYKTQ